MLLLAVLLLSSCATPDAAKIRREQTTGFLSSLDNRTRQEIPKDGSLTLQDSIRIAVANNLELQSARIQKNIATLERKTAFARFLPKVDAGLSQQWARYQPEAVIGPMSTTVSDRRIRQTMLGMQQPIFVPYTWFLYSMFRKGEDIQNLVVLRTRQLISLEVTGLFFRCLALEETGAFLQTALEQARALENEVRQARAVDMARAGDVAEAEALVLSRQFSVNENRRRLRQSRSELLEAMGLNPLSPVRLTHSEQPPYRETPLDDLVLEALLNRPELKGQDYSYAIAKDRVKIALTEFLPKIFGTINFSNTTDSFIRYQTQWFGGLDGVMSLFNGFADINAYKAAKQRAGDVYVRREMACLMVMLQTQQAFLNLQSAHEQCTVSQKLLTAREEQFRETAALRQEGLVQLSERLSALTRRDEARMQHAVAGYSRQVARAVLLDVTGRGVAPKVPVEE